MRKAIAIVAYDRSHYFEMVLPSILNQVVGGRPVSEEYDIFVFQDGLCVGDAKSDPVGHTKLASTARKSVPAERFFPQEQNLGVALHFDFIERLLFQERGYDFVLFCEDDLVLAPNYVEVTDLLAEKFKNDRRVGIVSCHPGNHRNSQKEQHDRYESYLPMEHLWGYGLFKSTWDERQPFVDQYLSYVGTVPYRQRDEKRIFDWLRACGFRPDASSQDYVKHCFTIALGYARVSTFFNLGLPIGRIGLHSTLKNFERLGLDKAVIYDGEIKPLGEFKQDKYRELLTHHSQALADKVEIPEEGINEEAVARWHRRLKDGELAFGAKPPAGNRENAAENEKSAEVAPPLASPAAATPEPEALVKAEAKASVPDKPEMDEAGLALFQKRLENSKCFLEYRAGGGCLMAARLGVPNLIGVGLDDSLLSEIRAKVQADAPDVSLVPHAVDIGPTGDWGKPIDRSKVELWPSYCVSVWQWLRNEEHPSPDLVLINGRFRVSSFFASMTFANPGTRVLFDNYIDRPFYHSAQKHFKIENQAGRMAEFVVPDNVDPRAFLADLLAYSSTVD